jgi:hypothetical protein
MSIWTGLNEQFRDEADDIKLDSEAQEMTEETAEESTLIPDDVEG